MSGSNNMKGQNFEHETGADNEALHWLEQLENRVSPKASKPTAAIPEWLQKDITREVVSAETTKKASSAYKEQPTVELTINDGDNLSWLDEIASGFGAPVEELPTSSWQDTEVYDNGHDETVSMEAVKPELKKPVIAEAPAEPVVVESPVVAELTEPDAPADETRVRASKAVAPDMRETKAPQLKPFNSGEPKIKVDYDISLEETKVSTSLPWDGKGTAEIMNDLRMGEDSIESTILSKTDTNPTIDIIDLASAIPSDPDEAIAWLENLAKNEDATTPLQTGDPFVIEGVAKKTVAMIADDEIRAIREEFEVERPTLTPTDTQEILISRAIKHSKPFEAEVSEEVEVAAAEVPVEAPEPIEAIIEEVAVAPEVENVVENVSAEVEVDSEEDLTQALSWLESFVNNATTVDEAIAEENAVMPVMEADDTPDLSDIITAEAVVEPEIEPTIE
ncbi:MAG: hypothetical protein KAG66_16505, partial [Methylococcales bacterium]|nr:hypothetical protein [Methylococcales bacterium]